MTTKLSKPSTGGEALLKKHGPKYFSRLSKDGWKKRKAERAKWNKQQDK